MSEWKSGAALKIPVFLLVMLLAMSFSIGAQAQHQGDFEIAGKVDVDFSQGANKNPTQGEVIWIRGILQSSNSSYYEGMSSLQRILFLDIPKTPPGHVHTLTISHLANKSTENHAYDFITSWPQALQAATEIGGPTMFVSLNECGPAIGPPASLAAICDFLHASGYTATPDCPDTMGFLIGDDVTSRVAAYEAHFGNRTVKIYGNAPITASSISFQGYDVFLEGADKYADYTLSWTSSSDSIVIELAGHLAAGLDPLQEGIGYGQGRGSGNISGGPYHFKLHKLDGVSLGNQDNQIQGADIQLPPPACYVTPESDSVCAGGSAIFEAEVIGGAPPYTWAWTKPPSATVLSIEPTLIISNVTIADEGQYQVVMTDSAGLMDTCYADLTVWPQPVCDTTGDIAVCEGQSSEFCATPDMSEYAWTGPGGFTANTQCTGPIGVEGDYQVIITDANGCQDTCSQYLTVYGLPSCNLACPETPVDCGSTGNKMAPASVTGQAPLTCEWTVCGSGWVETGVIEDTVIYTAGTDMGFFKLVVTDANGCKDSCEITCVCNEVVPVVLASFEATGEKGSVVLNWTTASEINCQRWEIYRGQQKDGEYAKMGELPGHGSTEMAHTYRWVDRQVQLGATYFYKLKQVDFDGSPTWSHAISATASPAVPQSYALGQNYPNPFNASTEIRYQTPKADHVSLKIYNTLGEETRTLVDADREANWHVVTWDGRDNTGSEVASGLYFCRLKAGDFSRTIKMVLLR